MKPATSRNALQVQAVLGTDFTVLELEESTRSAADAAAAIGCAVASIAKSLVFEARDGRPVLVIAAGSNRVDETAVAQLLGQPIRRADAGFVRAHTGYPIGGVPPLAPDSALAVLLDEDLLAEEAIWAAAGTPNAVFRLTPDQLRALSGGRPAAIASR